MLFPKCPFGESEGSGPGRGLPRQAGEDARLTAMPGLQSMALKLALSLRSPAFWGTSAQSPISSALDSRRRVLCPPCGRRAHDAYGDMAPLHERLVNNPVGHSVGVGVGESSYVLKLLCVPDIRERALNLTFVNSDRIGRKFIAGDHLRVRRPIKQFGYYHHGIYINDNRVIQFGGGISNKPLATIEAVSLSRFERSGEAAVTPHGGRTWWGAPRFETIAREVTIRRAERLLATHPEGLYNLLGYNCEQAANFCSTNSHESYQVRGYFAVRVLIGIPITLSLLAAARSSRLAARILWLWVMSGLTSQALYQLRGARFMKEVGRPLLTWEREQTI